ncbi:MAG: hypothetical protein DRP01_01565 [Archaeoglobales archaeon]|nr:MAG: hypothetical protein DRP01_01565 [Archaeoglobales archaeon]
MEARDYIALMILGGCFVLVGLSKVGWDDVIPVISVIMGYYFGYVVGLVKGFLLKRGIKEEDFEED